MKGNRTSISKARTYQEIGEFWDTHSASDFWDKGFDVDAEINIKPSKYYFSLDSELSKKVLAIAKKRGVSTNTLLNLWVQEKVGVAKSARTAKEVDFSRSVPNKFAKRYAKSTKKRAA